MRIRTGGCGGKASVEVDEDIKSRDKNAVEGIYDVVTLFVYFLILMQRGRRLQDVDR